MPETQPTVSQNHAIIRRVLRSLTAATAVAAVIAGVYFAVLIHNGPRVEGRYASYHFAPHDRADMLAFSKGKVLWHSCCGDEDYGTYALEPSGAWVWTCRRQLRPADQSKWRLSDPVRFILEPAWFSLRIVLEKDRQKDLTMRRRVLADYDL